MYAMKNTMWYRRGKSKCRVGNRITIIEESLKTILGPKANPCECHNK